MEAQTDDSARRWLTDRELAAELHISRAMVQKLRRAGMPSLAIGSARRYNPEAVVAWLRRRADDRTATKETRV